MRWNKKATNRTISRVEFIYKRELLIEKHYSFNDLYSEFYYPGTGVIVLSPNSTINIVSTIERSYVV